MRHKLTQHDIDKMKEEIEHRKVVVRKELLEHVKEARAHGDLSENFEYHAAKKEKNRNESRIRYLENMIKTAVVIQDGSGTGRVGLYDHVTVFLEEDGEEETFQIVTTVRQDALQNRISKESPFGRAVMGRGVGDRVYVQVNDHYGYYAVIRAIEKGTDDGSIPINSFCCTPKLLMGTDDGSIPINSF